MASKCYNSGTSSLPDKQLQTGKKQKKIQEKMVLIFKKLEK